MRELELLRRRIEMMKLKRPVATGIATKDALPTSLVDQDSLQRVPSSPGGLNSTPFAAVVPTTLTDKGSLAMTLTAEHHHPRPVDRATLSPRRRFQPVPPHPVPDRRQASIHLDGDFSQRHAEREQSFQILPRRRPPRCVLVRVRR
jgi:hypothetical protein